MENVDDWNQDKASVNKTVQKQEKNAAEEKKQEPQKQNKENKPIGGVSLFRNSELLNEAKSKICKDEKESKSEAKSKKDSLKNLFDGDDEGDDDLFSSSQQKNRKSGPMEKKNLFSTDSNSDDDKDFLRSAKSNKDNNNKIVNDNKEHMEQNGESNVQKKTLNARANARFVIKYKGYLQLKLLSAFRKWPVNL